ncbi:MAG: hypothetical protein ABIR24_10650 [Verrucomicrobiota bacterium]
MKRQLARLLIVICCLALPFIVWRLWLAHDVHNRLEAIRANGFPSNGGELNKWYAAVPDSENTALALTQAFELLRIYSDGRSNQVTDFKFSERNLPLSPAQTELLRGYVELNMTALEKANEALKRTASRYPADFSLLANTPLPHLPHIRTISRLNEYQAALAIQSGDGKNATRNIEKILLLAGSLDNEPCLISQLVRMMTVRLAVSTLERRVNGGPLASSEITNLVAAIAQVKTTNSMSRALTGERAMSIPWFQMSQKEVAQIALPTKDGEEKLLSGGRPFILCLVGYYDRDLRYLLETMDTSITLVSLTPPNSLSADRNFARSGAEAKKRKLTVSGLVLSTFAGTAAQEAKFIAYVRLANLSLSIEEFRNQTGRLPDILEEFTPKFVADIPEDPFDGMSLRYRKLQKGYLIYSIGADRRDNDGLEEADKKQSPDKLSFDLTFVVER